jgi:hypothetical protein
MYYITTTSLRVVVMQYIRRCESERLASLVQEEHAGMWVDVVLCIS